MWARPFLICFLILCGIDTIGSQTAPSLTKEVFFGIYYSAFEESQKYPRRLLFRAERFEGKQRIRLEEWKREYDNSYNSRFVSTIVSDGKSTETEMIVYGEMIFCRNRGKWTKADSPCLISPQTPQVLGVISSVYKSEDANIRGESPRHYREYTRYSPMFGVNQGKESFMETSYWLDPKGRLLKRSVRVGVVGSDRISYEESETFEYDPIIKIDRPIK